MGSAKQGNRVEMIFIIVMVVLCGSLTILQYRWTGEVARAEMSRLRESFSNQVGQVCKSFDSELAKACMALVPTGSELDRETPEAVHLRRLREWKTIKPRPIFKRIMVAVPSGNVLNLLEIDPQTERVVPAEWPAEWSALRKNLSAKLNDGSPPFVDRSGMLWEIPVIGDGRPGDGGPEGPDDEFDGGDEIGGPPNGPPGLRSGGVGEREWVILELDGEYLRKSWFPELIATSLVRDGTPLCDIEVRSKVSPPTVFYSSEPSGPQKRNTILTKNFNFQGSVEGRSPGPPLNPLWTLEASEHPGALEDLVAGSRKRNLIVAVVLNALILAAGLMLLRATRRSRKLAEERMKFVANVSHELRTPLTVIRGAAHNMNRGIVKSPEGIAKYTGLIIEHAEGLSAMVEQILDFSGTGKRGQPGDDHIPVHLGQVLRDAIRMAKSDARYSACEIDLQLSANLPRVIGDSASLRRAFQNLIENAAKHGGAGRIEVTAVSREGNVEITVRDEGPGIPADEFSAIFSPFFRGSIARSNQTRGSGLGLSLVRETAEAHGGKISVASESGKGSTFTFSLPV